MLNSTNLVVMTVNDKEFDRILQVLHLRDIFNLPQVIPIFPVKYITFATLQTRNPFRSDVGQTWKTWVENYTRKFNLARFKGLQHLLILQKSHSCFHCSSASHTSTMEIEPLMWWHVGLILSCENFKSTSSEFFQHCLDVYSYTCLVRNPSTISVSSEVNHCKVAFSFFAISTNVTCYGWDRFCIRHEVKYNGGFRIRIWRAVDSPENRNLISGSHTHLVNQQRSHFLLFVLEFDVLANPWLVKDIIFANFCRERSQKFWDAAQQSWLDELIQLLSVLCVHIFY